MVAFSRLPDACLLALFEQLPPEDQLRARSVCRKWDSLIPVAARTRRSLIIVITETQWNDFTYLNKDELLQPPITIFKRTMRLLKKEDGSPLFPQVHITAWDCLNIASELPESVCHLTASTFAGVSNLKVIIYGVNPKHFKMVAILLQHWRQQLTNFQLIEDIDRNEPLISTDITKPFYAAINSLSSLKRLILILAHLPLGDLSVISHLEELDIYSYYNDRPRRKLASNLQKYGKSNRNLIRVGCHYNSDRRLKRFTKLSSHLRQALTQLECLDIGNQELPTVCNHFQNLMTLEMCYNIDRNGLVPLFQELSKLKQLIYLSLNIMIRELPVPNAHHPLPQLPSVKAFILEPIYLHTPQHMAALDIGWLFPNLQVIYFHFRGWNFIRCGFDDHFPDFELQLATECLRQVFRPLKRRIGDKVTILHDLGDLWNGICSAEWLLAAM